MTGLRWVCGQKFWSFLNTSQKNSWRTPTSSWKIQWRSLVWFCEGEIHAERWMKRVWGEHDMCVIGLPVVTVSCSPPVSLDKLTLLFMPALPLLLFQFHYIFYWDLQTITWWTRTKRTSFSSGRELEILKWNWHGPSALRTPQLSVFQGVPRACRRITIWVMCLMTGRCCGCGAMLIKAFKKTQPKIKKLCTIKRANLHRFKDMRRQHLFEVRLRRFTLNDTICSGSQSWMCRSAMILFISGDFQSCLPEMLPTF